MHQLIPTIIRDLLYSALVIDDCRQLEHHQCDCPLVLLIKRKSFFFEQNFPFCYLLDSESNRLQDSSGMRVQHVVVSTEQCFVYRSQKISSVPLSCGMVTKKSDQFGFMILLILFLINFYNFFQDLASKPCFVLFRSQIGIITTDCALKPVCRSQPYSVVSQQLL